MSKNVIYVIVRRDLMSTLNWPLGALIAQTCHAVSAVLWTYRDDPNTMDYMNDVSTWLYSLIGDLTLLEIDTVPKSGRPSHLNFQILEPPSNPKN